MVVCIPGSIVATIQLFFGNLNVWIDFVRCFVIMLSPIWFYSERKKFYSGYTEVSTTINKLFKCRTSGTDEIFYLAADSEEEAELYFETTTENKQVFIEELPNKLLGFEMKIDNTGAKERT